VDSSAGFLVGDYFTVSQEFCQLLGPGVTNQPPESNTWEFARGLAGSLIQTVADGALVRRCVSLRFHVYQPDQPLRPPQYTLPRVPEPEAQLF
jgi:hypothetical protein